MGSTLLVGDMLTRGYALRTISFAGHKMLASLSFKPDVEAPFVGQDLELHEFKSLSTGVKIIGVLCGIAIRVLGVMERFEHKGSICLGNAYALG